MASRNVLFRIWLREVYVGISTSHPSFVDFCLLLMIFFFRKKYYSLIFFPSSTHFASHREVMAVDVVALITSPLRGLIRRTYNFAPERANQTYFIISVILLLRYGNFCPPPFVFFCSTKRYICCFHDQLTEIDSARIKRVVCLPRIELGIVDP